MNHEKLTEHDWLQIDQAARGCISGTSDEWPALRNAIAKATGRPFGDRKSASWLQGFCEGILIQTNRSQASLPVLADETQELDVWYGTNAGVKCDTDNGPCACGAWH
jgi:hypothetical protein